MELKQVNRGYHYDLPTKAELNGIHPGRTVRLSLSSGSRFWATVSAESRNNSTYCAVSLDNIGPVRKGDPVYFRAEHVFDLL